ncbi:antibiotic biosynthesis monooxygenase [Ensifer sp. HO-A22]|uniref:Antibiotic biosynthesis monooxygenase n=1 Tax=Ensifer oleiphilus TaxID=2742698 RepID=A0A7Y6QBZ5_9HYPH|nr:antibiotic biosynthesis monooxygenase [Ensifer oleiphilus]NVD42550.1 antibiotic biosynthesis monooxygenase [Ensifer oleiphilus]
MKPLSHFFSVIDYTASGADDQPAIAAEFARLQEDWVASYPRFVSARFPANTDGSSVCAIVEWASEMDFHNLERVSDNKGRIAALAAAFEHVAAKGARRTFRAIGEVGPTPAASPAKTGA